MENQKTWVKYRSDEGYDYYYNQITSSSQWERPEDYYSDDETLQTTQIVLENVHNSSAQLSSAETHQTMTTNESYNYLHDETHFEFDYNTSASVFDELSRLTLFQTIQDNEKSAINSGQWCKISCRKLEVLQMCLENYGTEEEWKFIFFHENRIVMRYLLKFMKPTVHPQFQDAAARCLAYAYMSYSTLWDDFLKDMKTPSPIYFYRITFIAVERMKILSDLPPDEIPKVPYAGFDIRDIADYNLENLEEYNLPANQTKTGLFDMKGSTDVSTTIDIWLLLLFEMHRTPNRVIGDDFRNRRLSLLGMGLNLGLGMGGSESASKSTRHQLKQQYSFDSSEETNSTEKFLQMITDLLNLSKKFKETSYLLCIKVIAAMNWQIPTKDLVGSTEVAEMCARLQFGGDVNGTHVNVSEGLLHLLNDVGYPNQKLPETLPTIQLCYELITTSGYEGFFYINDVKILVEVIVRELSNLPWDEDSWNPQRYDDETPTDQRNRDELIIFDGLNGPVEGTAEDITPHNELLRQMYLKLTIALMTRTSWPTLEGYYKKTELDSILQWWLDNGMVSCPVTVNLVSEVLEKKLGAI